MPIYEYQCDACNHIFEQLVISKGDEPSDCPKCGAKKVQRLMSCTSFVSASGSGSSGCAPGVSSGFS